ncbi:MAG TPA: tol-pal system protein YbgF, partial [Polyangiaceae bacterium LLY-WYZ-15_(1-7)]|nr:tol-pal system protein YbgF [Polyangiaceae bacterium LLY-WYZ-15_(1-7)]
APAPARAPAPRADGALEAYRDALGALRARRFGEAEAAFERFAASHPQHRLAPNARYWRAEALYIQRRYPAARAAFEAYLRAHPSGEKAPDALLKIGLCHQRMGDGMAARRAYERLRREHPQSVAARLASREDA